MMKSPQKRVFFIRVSWSIWFGLMVQMVLSAQYSLTVGDPRNSWYLAEGSISEASLNIEPKGLFMKYDLFLEFSSEGSYWTHVSDTLEVVLNFQLPEEALVFDSWLWIEGEPVQAKIMDKWTASLIYEGIVKRRRDPSILSKTSATQYELRVFPMAGNETRKVKISYLMPADWSRKMVTTLLPTPILQTSAVLPDAFIIHAMTPFPWSKPFFPQYDELEFTTLSDTAHTISIPGSMLNHELEIGFDPPLENGLYFSKFQDGNEGIYQLALYPSDLMDTMVGNKVAVLVDYDKANTSLNVAEILEITRNEMLKTLTGRDSFNLVISGLSAHRYSNQWEAATEANILSAFDVLSQHLAGYSNLGTLIAEGIDFIHEQGSGGSIILVANADQYTDFEVANNLIRDILEIMTEPIPFHISDYQSVDYWYNWYNNRYYVGNEYLYSNLAKQTTGSFQRYLEVHSVSKTIARSLQYSGGSINAFDLHTGMNNGFCHSRYLIGETGNRAYINDGILQIGKYKGDFPMELELSGEYNNQIFNKRYVVEDTQSFADDTIAEETWTGQFIHELESEYPSNDVISEIIYYSLAERVLSRYTSFLCLEPGFDPSDIEEGEEDRIFIGVAEEPQAEDFPLTVYPNPFTDQVTIELSAEEADEIIELSVYSMTGTLLYRFDPEELFADGVYSVTWDGTTVEGSPVQPGMYLLVCRTTRINKTIKLLKQ